MLGLSFFCFFIRWYFFCDCNTLSQTDTRNTHRTHARRSRRTHARTHANCRRTTHAFCKTCRMTSLINSCIISIVLLTKRTLGGRHRTSKLPLVYPHTRHFSQTTATNTENILANPSSTHAFHTVGIWETGLDQDWAITTGPTPDKDDYFFGTVVGASAWTYLVTKEGAHNGMEITNEQRRTFSIKLFADFATSSPGVATRFVVYLNASDPTQAGWYSTANIPGAILNPKP